MACPTRLSRTILSACDAVLTALRPHARLGASSSPHVAALRALRRRCRGSADGGAAPTSLEICVPFIGLVRTAESSGPYTGAALSALSSLLKAGAVTTSEAAAELVDAVTACRFEQTDAAADEVVKMQIIQVLTLCLCGPTGELLTDDAAWEAAQTCFVNRNPIVHSWMLCHAAENALLKMVVTVFTRVGALHAAGTSHPLEGYGLPCAVKLLGFVCAQLRVGPVSLRGGGSGGGNPAARAAHESLRLVCLQLARTAIETAEDVSIGAISASPALLSLVRDDLSHAVLWIGRGGRHTLPVLSEALALLRVLWGALREHLKMQIEALFNGIFLRLLNQLRTPASAEADDPSEAESVYTQHEQLVVLESLADLTAQPCLLADLLVSFDCAPTSSDLLEALVTGLSRVGEAAGAASSAAQALATESMLNLLRCMQQRCSADGDEPAPGLEPAAADAVAALWRQKQNKRALLRAASKFNEKPSAGLKLLLAEGLIAKPLTGASVAQFLRTAPGLDKTIVGQYLGTAGKPVIEDATGTQAFIGDTARFHDDCLKAFVGLFDFRGQKMLTSLRMFLAAFRLPGEAQQIDRIVQAFADAVYGVCAEAAVLNSSDVAYLLTFSIIMLQTDLHNPNIKPEKRMSLKSFLANNTSYGPDIGDGKPLSHDLLEDVYRSVAEDGFQTLADGPAGEITVDRWRDLLRCAEADPAGESIMAVHVSPADQGRHDRQALLFLWRPVLDAVVRIFLHGKSGDEVDAEKLSSGLDLVLLLAKVVTSCGLGEVFDTVLFVLCGFTGLLAPAAASPHLAGGASSASASASAPQPSSANGSSAARNASHVIVQAQALLSFESNPAARMAAVAVFGICHRLGDHCRASWLPVLHLVFKLRDLRLLTRKVLSESDGDLLAPAARRDLDGALVAVAAKHAREAAEQRGSPRRGSGDRAADGGGGGGRGLLGWFTGAPASPAPKSPAARAAGAASGLGFEAWDACDDEEDEGFPQAASQTHPARTKSPAPANGVAAAASMPNMAEARARSMGATRRSARRSLAPCKIHDLVTETRYMSDTTLLALVHTLVELVDANLPPDEREVAAPAADAGAAATADAAATDEAAAAAAAASPMERLRRQVYLPPVSAPSLALAEVLLAEIALRNRDRVAVLWPSVAAHYAKRLANATTLSAGVEKAATGLLRVAARVASRKGMAEPAIAALAWLAPPHADPRTATLLAPLLGAGVLRLLSANAETLGALPQDAWRRLFDAMTLCAGAGGAAASSAFQALCFLLHEPQLKAAVPVTCAHVVSAFVEAPASTSSLALAALDLLTILHTRLEVLIPAEAGAEAGAGAGAGDHGLWTTCWVPILRALATASADGRVDVQRRALALLRDALLDRHAVAVPPAQVLRILSEVVVPVSLAVCGRLRAETKQLRRELAIDEVAAQGDGNGGDGDDELEDGGAVVVAPTGGGSSPADRAAAETVEAAERQAALAAIAAADRTQELCLDVNCRAFLRHLSELLPLRTFHELWLQLLELLQVYLVDTGAEAAASSGAIGSDEPAALASEQLKNLLLVLGEAGAFTPGEDTIGEELLGLTVAVVERFKGSREVLAMLGVGASAEPGDAYPPPPPPPPGKEVAEPELVAPEAEAEAAAGGEAGVSAGAAEEVADKGA